MAKIYDCSPGHGVGNASAMCVMPMADRSVPALRAFARVVAESWGVAADSVDALCLVTTELATNSVRHSGGTEVALLLVRDSRHITAQVRDTGTWRPARGTSAAQRETATGGRGLALVRAYCDTCQVHRDLRGTTVRAELGLHEGTTREAESAAPLPAQPLACLGA